MQAERQHFRSHLWLPALNAIKLVVMNALSSQATIGIDPKKWFSPRDAAQSAALPICYSMSSVCPSVYQSVCRVGGLCNHTDWNSSKIISRE